MKERFNNRIKIYLLLSVIVLFVFNLFSTGRTIQIIEKYIDFNTEYTAVEFKTAYEGVYKFDDFYGSTFSEYSRNHVSEWYDRIDDFSANIEKNGVDNETFYDYLDKISMETSLSIEIVDLVEKKRLYPRNDLEDEDDFSIFNFDEIKKALYKEGNVLHETQNDTEYKTSKIVKRPDGTVLSVSYSSLSSRFAPVKKDQQRHLYELFDKIVLEDNRIINYYIVNSKNEVLFTNQEHLECKVLNLKDIKKNDLLTHKGQTARLNYSKKFYLNEKPFINHSVHLVPLNDGNRVVLILESSEILESINKIRILSFLMSIAGVFIIYILGWIIMIIIDKNDLTARRVTRSSQSNRMVILMFVVLLLLNCMATVQLSKVYFFYEYEKAVIKSLDKYIAYTQHKESEFRRFIEWLREDAIVESTLITDGIELFMNEEDRGRVDQWYSSQAKEYIDTVESIESNSEMILASIEERGYYEYYEAPKIFYKNDFDSFYENYILETLVGESLHPIKRLLIYPNKVDGGYIKLSKDISKQINFISKIRNEFNEISRLDENEIFLSNVKVYNDTGTIVLANDGQEKFASRKLKDELTDYPLWYWYQFKRNEMFRTVVKTVEGNYKEQYSLVGYSDSLEYYFVYNIDHKTLFYDMERLYNIYVSAIMFLLVSVFLTLGVKIKIKKRG